MITKLFTEINEKMDEVEKILKDNNYFTNLEKRIEEYNNKMMAIYNNEATEYINRVNRAIEYIDEYTKGTPLDMLERNNLDNILDILKGSDKDE